MYRGEVLEGEVAEAAEEIIQETCKELEIEVIALAVTLDQLHLKTGMQKKKSKRFYIPVRYMCAI
jgi:REP element-mobilizing transposase RayT